VHTSREVSTHKKSGGAHTKCTRHQWSSWSDERIDKVSETLLCENLL